MPIKLSKRLAKFLPYCLSRRPDEFGLIPDMEGWITIKDLLKALHEEEAWRGVSHATLKEALLYVQPQQIEMEEKRIRGLPVREEWLHHPRLEDPPSLLYHAVRIRAYPVIREHGLKPTKYPWVVLCRDTHMANRLGKRNGQDLVIVEIRAREAANKGIIFYQAGELLVLADHVPPSFLHGPPVERIYEKSEKVREKQRSKKLAIKEHQKEEAFLPGSFIYDIKRHEHVQKETHKGKKKKITWKEERRKSKKRA